VDRRDPVGGFRLACHLGQLAATGRTLPLLSGEFVPNLHDRQFGLVSGAVSRVWGTGRRRRRGVRPGLGTFKHPRAHLLQFLQRGEDHLLAVRNPAQARDLRSQLQILRDEALIFAIEEEADLT
jgi:hypothetical protein